MQRLLFLLPVAVIVVFFFLPVISIFRFATLEKIVSSLRSHYYMSIISFTFIQAIVSTLFAVAIGLPGACIMSHVSFKGKSFFKSLTTVPFVLPSILVVIGFVLCFGNSGIINRMLMRITNFDEPPLKILYSFKAIILAHSFYNFPVSLRLISSAWGKIGKNRIEAAQSMGAGRLKIFLTISLPAILPSIIASASLIFIFCFMSFAVILVLGGGPQFTTIEVEIYRLARINIDIESASSLALIGALLTSVFTFIYIKLQNKVTIYSVEEPPVIQQRFYELSSGLKTLIIFYLSLIIILLLGPLAAIIVRAFQTRASHSGNIVFSLKQYLHIFESPYAMVSIKNTLKISFYTLLISIPTGLIASFFIARKKVVFPAATETLFMLPIGLSSVVLGLGYYALFSKFSRSFSSGILIVFAHSVICLPFVVRNLTTGIKTIPQSLTEASYTLGASSLRTILKIDLPMLSSSIISAAAFAFCISSGEINSVLILSNDDSLTIPVIIYRFISAYNYFGACAMGTILMLICGTSFYLIEKFGGNDLF